MKDKKATLSKKIKSYSALAGSVIAVGATADAQVVYTDVAPDVTVNTPGGFYNLDLNNDGTTDFQIMTNSVSTSGYVYDYVAAIPSQGVNAIDTIAGGYAEALAAGVGVCTTSLWADSISNPYAGLLALNLTAPFAFTTGNFFGATGKFVGLRFQKTGVNYNGWVRLNVAADAKSFTVIDYAYKNNPTACSVTGLLTDVGIAESALANEVTIYSAEQNITVKLNPSVTIEGTIIISNTLGQEVAKVNIANSETVIPMHSFSTGVYLVTVEQSNGSYTKRVSVK